MCRKIGDIGNTYGDLSVCEYLGMYTWTIECPVSDTVQQIPKYLYDTLNRFQDEEDAKWV